MFLPAPNLDDRRFQDLVDDAKRLVQQRCPDWTDHNVSDPGVTLIEAFAQMVDQLIYRLNRVPDRHYVKFLELIGVRLFPPAAARGTVTFWLAAPQPSTVLVRVDTEVATPRTDTEDAVVFSTVAPLSIVSCELQRVATMAEGDEAVDQSSTLESGGSFSCFQATPVVGDAFLIGLTAAVPSCVVALRIDARVEGIGVDPRQPPIVWEAWTESGWTACELERDETGGLNRLGDVVLHVPAGHQQSIIARQRAGWLRARFVAVEPGLATYTASPRILGVRAFTVGGTVGVMHAEAVYDEQVGLSTGLPGQRFPLERRPVVPWEEPSVLRVGFGDDWAEWTAVDSFAGSGPDDRHFRLDPVAGEVQFGPAVRQPDGTLRLYGAVPPKGAVLRLSVYRTGGGPRGNVARGQVRVLKTSVPYIARVENRQPAVGGVRGETVEDAKARAPLTLRSSGRAVTAEDFVQLAREVAPDAARVHCVPAGDGADAGGVRVLLVPQVAGDSYGRLQFEDLRPPPTTLTRIQEHLDERRLVGTRLVVEPPFYQGVTVVTRLTARDRHKPDQVREDALTALYNYFSPLRGGPEQTGWPFGRPVQAGEVYAVLARLPGVDLVEEVKLFAADPVTGERDAPVERIELGKHALVFSYQHQVRVQ